MLARERVRHVDEPLALIVAITRAQALDAAERIDIAYTPLPAVTDASAALDPAAPQLTEAVFGNCCHDWLAGDHAAAAAGFARDGHVARLRLHNHRIVTNPMEPRGGVGQYDAASGRYTLSLSSQAIHNNPDRAALILGVPPGAVRFIAHDVGGGFGAKNFSYPEPALILWAARHTGRTVK